MAAGSKLVLPAALRGVSIRELVEREYERNGQNISATARALNVRNNTIRHWLGLNKKQSAKAAE